jgi:hypothetical protein
MASPGKIGQMDNCLENVKETVIKMLIARLVYIVTRKTQATMFPLDVRQVVKVIV